MRELVRQSLSDYQVIELARYLVGALPQQDYIGEAKVIHAFVRDQIRYTRDPRNLELIQTPIKTLEIGQGDCDDKSILTSSLLEILGIKSRFVAVAFSGQDYFSHVLVEAKINNKWIPLETTEPVAFGWYPSNVTKRLVVEI